MAKKTEKRKFVDWDSIEPLYRAGVLSLNDICRQYAADHINSQVWNQTVTHTAIRKKAKEKKWTRNLANRVSERIKERLVSGLVSDGNQKPVGGSDNEIIDRAADTGVNIVLRHRSEILELQTLEKHFLDQLAKTPKKIYHANFQGNIIEKEYDVTLNENSVTLKNLASVRAQRIALERQAHNLSTLNEQPGIGVIDNRTPEQKLIDRKIPIPVINIPDIGEMQDIKPKETPETPNTPIKKDIPPPGQGIEIAQLKAQLSTQDRIIKKLQAKTSEDNYKSPFGE